MASLNPNDVILGRGLGHTQYVGNARFRSRVKERQEEYLAIKGHSDPAKARIAKELVDQTHALGGRFLKQVEGGSPGQVFYQVATEKAALEKCKQTLRDYRKKAGSSDRNDGGNNREKGVREQEGKNCWNEMVAPESLSLLSTLVCVQQNTVAMPTRTNPALPLQLNCSVQKQNGTLITPYTYVPSGGIFQELSQNVSASEDDLSEFLLSFIPSDRATMTEEQVELEQATMTDEERAEALVDLFGKRCAIDTHNNKRARKDLDRKDIEFLVRQMRHELNQIPKENKSALMEAQSKCHAPDELSDARLENFLRCEGMNAKVCLEV